MEWPTLDWHVGGVDSASAASRKLASFKLADVELVVASEVSPVIEIDIGVPSGAVHSIVALFGCQLDRAGLHSGNKIINPDVSHFKSIESILFNVVEGFWLLEGPPQTGPVFYVAAIAADAGVEDIF